jgi:hypothetical protein
MAFETISESNEMELEKSLESPHFDWRQFPMLSSSGATNNSGFEKNILNGKYKKKISILKLKKMKKNVRLKRQRENCKNVQFQYCKRF